MVNVWKQYYCMYHCHNIKELKFARHCIYVFVIAKWFNMFLQVEAEYMCNLMLMPQCLLIETNIWEYYVVADQTILSVEKNVLWWK